MPTKGLTAADVDRLCTDVRERMLAALIEVTESPAGQQALLPNPPPPPLRAVPNGRASNGAFGAAKESIMAWSEKTPMAQRA